MLEDIENLFSIEHAGAILGQPPAFPQLGVKTLPDGHWLPRSPTAKPGVLASES